MVFINWLVCFKGILMKLIFVFCCYFLFYSAIVIPVISTFMKEAKGTAMVETYQLVQEKMLEAINAQIEETSCLTGISSLSTKVLKALRFVPRHLFVSEDQEPYAYLNSALPIGEGQTISQPFIVAIMTELLDIRSTDKVLEIGTGSGYQAAILSQLASKVYTIEIFPSLMEEAVSRFKKLGYLNIQTYVGNGANGWSEYAPYNKIIVTAASETVPHNLIEQLSPNGIMVIPLGKDNEDQYLTVIKKDLSGKITQKMILPVRFVPFTNRY